MYFYYYFLNQNKNNVISLKYKKKFYLYNNNYIMKIMLEIDQFFEIYIKYFYYCINNLFYTFLHKKYYQSHLIL